MNGRVRAAVAVVVLAATAAFPVPAGAGPVSDGYTVETRTVFSFVPEAQTVQVALRATITNNTPPVVGSRFVTESVLEEFGFPVLRGSTNFTASVEGGGALGVRTESTEVPDVTVAVVDLAPDLRFPNSATINVIYEIPSTGPRSDSLARINPAFATFPVFAGGDPGRTSIDVVVPDGFEIEMVGDQLVPRSGTDGSVYVAENIAEPELFTSFVVLSDNDRLGSQTVTVGDTTIEVRAWPDDPEWGAFVSDQITSGVPALEAAIGLPWPADESFEVIETLSPYLYGYAGWYTPLESSIEIGDELDPDVILHELSHLWFNQDLVLGRWLNEGLAEEFTSIVRAQTDGAVTDPAPIDPNGPGVLALNDWDDPIFQNDVTQAQETYGYQASWWVLDQIGDEIGDDALGEVVRTTAAGTISYPGDPEAEQVAGVADWRRFLDLVQDLGGSAGAEALFAEHVVTDDQQAELAARAVSRDAYDSLDEQGAGWSPPADVRMTMAEWSFDDADALIEESAELLDRREAIAADGPDLDLAALESAYEQADDLDELADTFDDAEDAAADLRAADDRIAGTLAPLRFIADIGHGPADDRDAAQAAFAEGDFDEAAVLAGRAADAADAAPQHALLRLALLGLAGAVVVLGVRIVRRRKRPPVEPSAF